MKKDFTKLAQEIIKNVGGEENVISLTHCITRLRFRLRDEHQADSDAISELSGVIKVLKAGGQYQVVIGNDVSDVYQAVLENSKIKGLAGDGEDHTAESTEITKGEALEKESLGSRIVDTISGIFMPFMGAFIGAGLLKGFLVLFTTVGWLSTKSTTYTILYAAGDGIFSFLPIFLAYCAGKKFHASPFLSMAIASAMVYPTITALFTSHATVTFFGIPVQLISYTSSVLPILVTCYVQGKFEQGLKKILPKIVSGLLIPVLDLVVILPLAFIVIGPITNIAANGVAAIIKDGLNIAPPIAGFAMAALWPVLIIFGLHWGIIPIALNNLSVLGYDYILPLTVGCNFGIAAACLAIFLKTRNNKVKEISGSAAVSALIGGVTEPGIYGVLLKYKRPMIIMCLVNGIGGAICAAFHVTRNVQMAVNLLTTPAIFAVYGPWGIVAILISFIGTFVGVWLFGYSDKMLTVQKPNKKHVQL
ncbi:PTS transporter subunit EIIC [Liquorilactobacillus satsumensis]|uniref:PTS transporter subunit EIIC n=1 Tax=Liquorilactobacillus satsumensis TaxID=259059 RepID=UPI0039E7A8D5